MFNDEINVDHFEIMYKASAEAPVKEIGRTSQWATYIGNIPMDQTANAYHRRTLGIDRAEVLLAHRMG